MMEQYWEIKDQYRDYILFYRLGDFYEMFFEDAQIASKELELTLTGRDCGEGKRAPMCGVPFHASEAYIGKLISAGYKVAICEQMEDPATAKGLVKRDIIRVVTPGTLIESDLLAESRNNYLASLYYENGKIGLCFADVSTAFITATAFDYADSERDVINELSTYAPAEMIVNVPIADMPTIKVQLALMTKNITVMTDERDFTEEESLSLVDKQFAFSADDVKSRLIAMAAGAALRYIADTQKSDHVYFDKLDVYESSQYLEIDANTRRNLELTETMLTKDKKGSLLWVLDKTSTAMGARLLRSRIEHPLTNAVQITRRQQAVSELAENYMLREELKSLLEKVLDLERLMTKIAYGTANGKDMRAICQTISVLPEVRSLLSGCESEELRSIYASLDELTDVCSLIDSAITEEPPFQIREGGIIKDGYSPEVDELRSIMENGNGYIKDVEEREKDATGIRNLRIGYNRVFGYYIEVTNSMRELVPENYIRKQTLANCERYITEELKDMESTILGAADKLRSLEYELFVGIRETVGEASDRIRTSAAALAATDVYVALADVAVQNGYVCPFVDGGDVVDIKDGRHPVVEQFVRDSYFVPNDAYLDTGASRLMLITGPNMAGKSTYMRQTALIVLMAQIGSYVPASSAHIGIVDKLFTRVGASDDLASGQSTFMLEMKEVAYILKNATKRSLIIYDEIGRGTSTYDGMSIARAVAEYTSSKKLGAKTMFATHYHELTELEGELDGIINYNVAAKKRGDDVTFLRKIVRGPADDSYGIEVAKLAGIPQEIIKRAKDILADLEAGDGVRQPKGAKPASGTGETVALSLDDAATEEIKTRIKATDINTLTPIEAMNMIYEWKKLLS